MGKTIAMAQPPGALQRMALVKASSWDEDSRTFELIISTERDVGDGVLLVHEDGAFRFPERPVPTTIDHSRQSKDVWGVIDELRFERVGGVKALIGRGRVDGTAEAMAVAVPRLRNGSARFSIGARVHRWQDPSSGSELSRATDWEMGETSLVVVGMDSASIMRSPTESTITDPPMPDENTLAGADPAIIKPEIERAAPVAPAPQPQPVPAVDHSEIERSAAEVRRERDVLRACVNAGISSDKADELVRSGKSYQDCVGEIFTLMRDSLSAAPAGHPAARISVTRDEGDTITRAITDTLDYRLNTIKAPTEIGRKFARRRSLDLLESYLVSRGVNTDGLSGGQIIDRAFHSTSDFPNILSDSANKRLLAGYEEEPQTFKPFCMQRNLPDFKPYNNVQLQGRMTLARTLEGGEYTGMTLTEGKATWQLATYTGKVLWTRQMIINDDLGAFESMITKAGRGARTTESDVVWGLLTSGTLTASPAGGGAVTGIDGQLLFITAHSNVGTGVIGTAAVNTARTVMGVQKDIAGNDLNLFPSYVLVPTALATAAEQYFYAPAFSPAAEVGANGPNVFAGRVQVIAENRLQTRSNALWYMVADPRRIETIEYGYLAGEEGPQISVTDRRDPDGAEMLVRMDFGAAVQDFRGFYRSTGA